MGQGCYSRWLRPCMDMVSLLGQYPFRTLFFFEELCVFPKGKADL